MEKTRKNITFDETFSILPIISFQTFLLMLHMGLLVNVQPLHLCQHIVATVSLTY